MEGIWLCRNCGENYITHGVYCYECIKKNTLETKEQEDEQDEEEKQEEED